MNKRKREESPPASPTSATSDSSHSALRSANVSAPSFKYLQTLSEALNIPTVMKCSLPPHDTLQFSTYEAFEIHYAKEHTNRCSSCHKNFPTDHFLELHIEENHDSLNDARRARGEKTYRCFVENCDKICSQPHRRRLHLIDKHDFPSNYDFLIVGTGIDKRCSMLCSRHRRLSSAIKRNLEQAKQSKKSQATADAYSNSVSPSIPDTDPPPPPPIHKNLSTADGNNPLYVSKPPDPDVSDLAASMSALKFVPPSVRFGRGGRRGGFSRS